MIIRRVSNKSLFSTKSAGWENYYNRLAKSLNTSKVAMVYEFHVDYASQQILNLIQQGQDLTTAVNSGLSSLATLALEDEIHSGKTLAEAIVLMSSVPAIRQVKDILQEYTTPQRDAILQILDTADWPSIVSAAAQGSS